MRTITKLIALLLISIFSLTFNGCKKPEKGETGPAGANGTAGKDGNANVTNSGTIILNNWTSEYDDGTSYVYLHTVPSSNITQAIRDMGVVMVYMQEVDSSWTALPFSGAVEGFSWSYNFNVNTGFVTMAMSGYDSFFGSPGVADVNADSTAIRIVAIAASGKQKLHDNKVDLTDLKEVTQCLNEYKN